jgi:hypothetical protein
MEEQIVARIFWQKDLVHALSFIITSKKVIILLGVWLPTDI